MALPKAQGFVAAIFLAGATSVACAETSLFGALLPPEATYRMHAPFEARLGGLAHQAGGVESGSADIVAEAIFGNISVNTDAWWDFAIMRAHVGGTFNTAGKTDGIYFGPLWTVALTDRILLKSRWTAPGTTA